MTMRACGSCCAAALTMPARCAPPASRASRCLHELGLALAWAREADFQWIGTRIESRAQLRSGSHVETIDEGREVPQQCRHRVRLDRVVQANGRWQCCAQGLQACGHELTVV